MRNDPKSRRTAPGGFSPARVIAVLPLLLALSAAAPRVTAAGEEARLYPVVRGGKWGFVDKAGKVVIAPSYDFVRKFSEGLAPVMTKGPSGALWGYVDNTGRSVIPPRFEEAEEFQGGIARVKVRGKTGYVGRTGKYVWEPAE